MISQKGLSRGGVFIVFIMVVALVGCMDDGEDGLPGADGAAGPPGTATCLDCHNTAMQNAISLEYQRSQHAAGEYVDYAGGRSSCAHCHSGTGFAEYIDTGEVDGNIENPVAIDCQHCHNTHTTFADGDNALRTTAAVPFVWDEGIGDTSVDFGDNSNLCANCHQSRRAEPFLSAPGDSFEITRTHYGPHHGPQANVLQGVGFAEITPADYPVNSKHLAAGPPAATCVTCHMAEYTDGEGGHTWHPSLEACIGCHATADFNYGGVQDEVEVRLAVLAGLLLSQDVIEWVVEEGDSLLEPVVGMHTMAQAQAFFNWIGLTEDGSLGVHNPLYVTALIEDSILAITP